MDLKSAGNVVVLVGSTGHRMGGSHRAMLAPCAGQDMRLPVVDPARGARTAHAVASCIARGLVRAAHDPSEGGMLPALAEMCFSGGLGAEVDLERVLSAVDDAAPPLEGSLRDECRAFAEDPHRYLLEIEPQKLAELSTLLGDVPHAVVATVTQQPWLQVIGTHSGSERIAISALRAAWESQGGEL